MSCRYTEKDIYVAAGSGFANLKKLARADLKKRWKTLSREQKFAAGRALVFMDDVATKPAKYFSRANTQDAWRFRAEYFAGQKNLDDIADAYYIVENPQGIVSNKAAAAMQGELGHEFYRFCNAVQNWEYDRTSNKDIYRATAPKFANEIVEMSKRYQELVAISQTNPLLRPIKQLLHNFQR